MFFIGSGDFLNNLLYFAFNSIEHETLYLGNFEFQQPSGYQMDPIFLLHYFFEETKIVGRNQQGMPQGRKERVPHGPTLGLHGGAYLALVGHFSYFFASTESS
jgi:hypothetical protein